MPARVVGTEDSEPAMDLSATFRQSMRLNVSGEYGLNPLQSTLVQAFFDRVYMPSVVAGISFCMHTSLMDIIFMSILECKGSMQASRPYEYHEACLPRPRYTFERWTQNLSLPRPRYTVEGAKMHEG